MKESMKSNPAEGVGIAVVLEKNDQGQEQHYVYLVNERSDTLTGCLVVSRGYGRNMETEQLIETSTLRHFLDEIPPGTVKKIEPIMPEVFGLNNEYWVSFWIGEVMFDKRYIFLAETIQKGNEVTIPLMNAKGVFIR
jgi:hypothetical protein